MELALVKTQRAFYYLANGKGPCGIKQEQGYIVAGQFEKYFSTTFGIDKTGTYYAIFCFLIS